MKMLAGLLPDEAHAAQAAAALRLAGLGPGAFSTLSRPGMVWKQLGGPRKLRVVVRAALIGALLGLLVGAVYGLPAAILNCTKMGCPLDASLSLVILIAMYWIVSGALLGGLVGLDGLERDLYSYVEGVRRGGALMIVEAPEELTAEITQILEHESGLLVQAVNHD